MTVDLEPVGPGTDSSVVTMEQAGAQGAEDLLVPCAGLHMVLTRYVRVLP